MIIVGVSSLKAGRFVSSPTICKCGSFQPLGVYFSLEFSSVSLLDSTPALSLPVLTFRVTVVPVVPSFLLFFLTAITVGSFLNMLPTTGFG